MAMQSKKWSSRYTPSFDSKPVSFLEHNQYIQNNILNFTKEYLRQDFTTPKGVFHRTKLYWERLLNQNQNHKKYIFATKNLLCPVKKQSRIYYVVGHFFWSIYPWIDLPQFLYVGHVWSKFFANIHYWIAKCFFVEFNVSFDIKA